MRKLFFQVMCSVDGFIAGPAGELDWFVVDADFDRYVDQMLNSIDTILFGRITYEALASYWPTATSFEAERMNQLPKVVFSRSLEQPSWSNTRIARNPLTEVERLRSEPGKDIALFGSGKLAATLAAHDLIDEYRVLIAPVFLAGGTPMLPGLGARRSLRLVAHQRFDSGTLLLRYERG